MMARSAKQMLAQKKASLASAAARKAKKKSEWEAQLKAAQDRVGMKPAKVPLPANYRSNAGKTLYSYDGGEYYTTRRKAKKAAGGK